MSVSVQLELTGRSHTTFRGSDRHSCSAAFIFKLQNRPALKWYWPICQMRTQALRHSIIYPRSPTRKLLAKSHVHISLKPGLHLKPILKQSHIFPENLQTPHPCFYSIFVWEWTDAEQFWRLFWPLLAPSPGYCFWGSGKTFSHILDRAWVQPPPSCGSFWSLQGIFSSFSSGQYGQEVT